MIQFGNGPWGGQLNHPTSRIVIIIAMNEILSIFRDGGPVMWPILMLSVIGLSVIINKLIEFHKFFKNTAKAEDPQAELDRLQRGFGFVSTVITAEPMLGILGTVTGIIKTFGALKVAASESPLAATAGIGEALITTAAGIVAALILLFPYNYLLGQLQKAATRLEKDAA